ncbi:hypothetical protein DFH05DRAFT_397500 [Lentinula detonsa]|uniref:Uncharacterized protein n=1 Tax=Lentinula detonsa TaxID=2804962 RepID=A0A9W8TTM8_9AGAR|nr:hypothetical protein DFH05DRAFT_397500 [Lentinula detonsa]
MKATIRIMEPKIESRSKNIIKIPKLDVKRSTKRHIRDHENIPSVPSSTTGLVITIPPAKLIKRGHEIESGEESTLMAVEERPSKRARKVVAFDNLKYESDDLTLTSSSPNTTRKPKTTMRRRNAGKFHPNMPATPGCSYSGLFDIYAMDHQDLCHIYRPEGSQEPQYENLYDALWSDANTDKCTARISLPTAPYGRKFGTALAPVLCDPISERPYDIELTRISHVNQVFYREHEKDCFVTRYNSDVSAAGKLPGVSGKTSVSPVGARDNGVLDSSGNFNLSRVWEKEDEDGKLMEIFEGHMSLRVRYRKNYERKGYGDGFDIGFAFWAIRTNDAG